MVTLSTLNKIYLSLTRQTVYISLEQIETHVEVAMIDADNTADGKGIKCKKQLGDKQPKTHFIETMQ